MGPKKPKKSKAELEEERLAREEEERKARLLEEKKAAEEAEKRRLEQLRIEAENKKQRQLELERLQIEYNDIVDDEQSKSLQLAAEEKRDNAAVEWLRYIEPSEEPNASLESDMNTFISLMEETKGDDLLPVMQMIRKIETIACAVEDVWSECLANHDTSGCTRALQNLQTLRNIIYNKLDDSTVKILAFSDDRLNDRMEMNIEESGYRVTIGMWASYAEPRPIRKSVIFESIGVQFDLQKQVLQQHDNFIFRMIRMPIVTYNMEAYELPRELVASLMGSKDVMPKNGTDEEKESFVPEPEEAQPSSNSRASPKTSPRSSVPETRLPSKYVVGDLFLFDILHAPHPSFHLRQRKWTMRNKSSNSTTLRKSAYPSSVPSRMVWKIPDDILMTDDMRVCCWDDDVKDWTEDGITDYQYSEANRQVHFYITTVGYLALVKPRTSDLPYKNWTLSPVLSKPVNALLSEKFSWTDPSELNIDLSSLSATSAAAAVMNKNNFDSFDENENEKSKQAKVEIPVIDAATLATMPKDTFERYARLSILTQHGHEVVIDIVGFLCKLVKPVSPVFADILDRLMHPGSLMRRLQRKGINILPNSVDIFTANNVTPKDPILENRVLLQLAKGASSLEFSSSPWNQTLNESQIGLLTRETCIYTCFPQRNEYECVFVEMDNVSMSYLNTPELGLTPGPGSLKYLLVMGNEYGEKSRFSHVPRPSEITHLDLPRVLVNRVSKESLERLANINQRFQKTVLTLLELARPYSLS